MSRTIRQKDKLQPQRPDSWHGQKVAGRYTQVEGYERTGNGHRGFPIYRAPTKSEYFHTWKHRHGESRSGSHRSPSRFYRKKYDRFLKTFNERQYQKWLNDSEYDPVFVANPLSCWWDWS